MVTYLNFACTTASSFWLEVCTPSHTRFFERPGRLTAIQAAWPTWHVHEWVWHERNPGQDTRNNRAYERFRDGLITGCAGLGWLRDVSDASKHCGIGRTPRVDQVSGTGLHTTGEITDVFGMRPDTQADPLVLHVDGVPHAFDSVLRTAIVYWRTNYFA